MFVVIGTDSEYKLNAIKKSFYELDFKGISFIAKKVSSGVSEQPMQVGETLQGSINRAKQALLSESKGDIGIGVEFGYEPFNNTLKMICWASIYTKEGKLFSEQSSTLELPQVLR